MTFKLFLINIYKLVKFHFWKSAFSLVHLSEISAPTRLLAFSHCLGSVWAFLYNTVVHSLYLSRFQSAAVWISHISHFGGYFCIVPDPRQREHSQAIETKISQIIFPSFVSHMSLLIKLQNSIICPSSLGVFSFSNFPGWARGPWDQVETFEYYKRK